MNQNNSKPTKPSVFDYLDMLSYLKDYYSWRKGCHTDFSYEFWSDELDFKSRSYIRMMVIGKSKVSNKFIDAFTKLNFIDKNEENYFFYLAQYSQAKNHNDRNAYGAKLIQILKNRPTQNLIEPDEDFVLSPRLPRLFTLLGFKDILPTLANFSKLMNLSEEETLGILNKFEFLGLAKKSLVDGEVHWLAVFDRFKIKDDSGNLNLMKFHELSLKDAIEAFSVEKSLRKYRSLIFPLSESELSEFYLALDNFFAEQVARFSPTSYQNRRLFQMNFNIHPVALPVEPQGIRFEEKSNLPDQRVYDRIISLFP